ncbi:uncharacterized protein LOC122387702 isoform X2 [Amphibalanus amphitrite]|uniref:uncharacterized protein LOC122367403 n=2 Tax=Amphibalanus amphitrite TaxID=1232801 RepID=UPI001C90409D|nr:uncharacterized protein LOC122367403 [Amphibalanus amphitrite]XP_043234046.1 uncharacterized protein LOC122387702 isoform X2 [Amphibalanus amphitrite]
MASVSRAPEFDAAVESFGAYSRRLEQHFVANSVGEDEVEKRRAILLSAVGASTFSLLEDLIAPAAVGDKTFKELVKILVDHFEPQQSAIVSRFRFHSCTRDAGESVSSFSARLRKLAKPCKFQPGQLDEMLRDRLVCGIQHERLQSRLLSEPRLTLDTALEIAQAHESAAASAAELSGRSESSAVIGRVDGTPRRMVNDSRPALVNDSRRALVNDSRRALVNDSRPALVNDSRRALVNDNRRPLDTGGAASRAPPARGACSRCLSRRHVPAACPFRSQNCYACGAVGHTRAACRSRAESQRVRLLEEEEQPEPSVTPGTSQSGAAPHNDAMVWGAIVALR